MEAFIGIPYVPHGRDYTGADCWGLLYLFYRDRLKLAVPSYSAEMEERRFCKQDIAPLIGRELQHWDPVSVPHLGDAVLLRSGRHETHVGVFIGRNRLLHSEGPTPSVIERLDDLRIRNRIVGFYRLKTC
jgi:cell wall-associated NlpC family hydrolase